MAISHTFSPSKRGLGRAGLKRKVPGTNPLLKQIVFSQSPQIQRATFSSQKPQIPMMERVT